MPTVLSSGTPALVPLSDIELGPTCLPNGYWMPWPGLTFTLVHGALYSLPAVMSAAGGAMQRSDGEGSTLASGSWRALSSDPRWGVCFSNECGFGTSTWRRQFFTHGCLQSLTHYPALVSLLTKREAELCSEALCLWGRSLVSNPQRNSTRGTGKEEEMFARREKSVLSLMWSLKM